ncbi:pickpocket protein 28-like isoform X1 [Teleopsis dalmanni]|uniref:pickpocket protein 28-like isoform X1 n=1 Tax=Teleopsis dalmanni TaxID=139649 RepID=UPI0018CCFF35|nr:pickpocket protein 28-like isoform X1 [Teleopsis dalmanni]
MCDLNDNESNERCEEKSKSKSNHSKWRSNTKKATSEIFYEYCSNTSIHGVQYFGQRRPITEQIFWILVFLVSIVCCFSLIMSVYHKWNETPVIVSFSEKTTPVWNIPFPAITICSETKRILKTEGMTYANFYNNLTSSIRAGEKYTPTNITKDELDEFRTLLHICNTQIIDKGMPLLSTSKIDYYDILNQMLPNFERYFFFCKWFNHFGTCDTLFKKTYTEEGICYTFNGLSSKDLYREDTYQHNHFDSHNAIEYSEYSNRTLSWSLQNGYDTDSGFKTYPARVLGAGARAGIFIALQSFKQETDYYCRGPIQGFKVLLHSPDDVPHVSKDFVRIPTGKEVLIAVKPNMITTSIGIDDYHPLRRQCFLHNERQLRFFKIYTQSNCELECLANFTLEKCGCVKFSMPRSLYTPVCNEDKIYCYDRAENDLLMSEFTEGLKHTAFNFRGPTKCNCMPACTSLTYNAEISQANFDLEEMLAAGGDTSFLEEFPGSQMSRLSIYFKESQFITSKRSELYGITDFLANCGGIFGLFMGFSILSMVEIFYHATLRLISNIIRLAKNRNRN